MHYPGSGVFMGKEASVSGGIAGERGFYCHWTIRESAKLASPPFLFFNLEKSDDILSSFYKF
jgi:hypothetical protein